MLLSSQKVRAELVGEEEKKREHDACGEEDTGWNEERNSLSRLCVGTEREWRARDEKENEVMMAAVKRVAGFSPCFNSFLFARLKSRHLRNCRYNVESA